MGGGVGEMAYRMGEGELTLPARQKIRSTPLHSNKVDCQQGPSDVVRGDAIC